MTFEHKSNQRIILLNILKAYNTNLCTLLWPCIHNETWPIVKCYLSWDNKIKAVILFGCSNESMATNKNFQGLNFNKLVSSCTKITPQFYLCCWQQYHSLLLLVQYSSISVIMIGRLHSKGMIFIAKHDAIPTRQVSPPRIYLFVHNWPLLVMSRWKIVNSIVLKIITL